MTARSKSARRWLRICGPGFTQIVVSASLSMMTALLRIKISEWLQVHGTGSNHYASICGADGSSWAEKESSPHCTSTDSLME